MPNIDRHAPGDFCWIELATTDQNAAKSFYQDLFGWTVHDSPMGPGQFYSMFQVNGRNAAAAYTIQPEQTSQGVPPHWMLYVSSDNADESTARATQLGGKVLAPAFDVFDFGRMAVLQDPTGATFSIWQPKTHTGIGITGVPGTLCWADLNTRDVARAKDFYSQLFGWQITPGEKDPSGYLHIKTGEHFIGGLPPAEHQNPNAPPHWLPYFTVEDCDATANKAKQRGANIYLAPMTMEGVGRMAVLADPQGAVFAIFKASPHPH